MLEPYALVYQGLLKRKGTPDDEGNKVLAPELMNIFNRVRMFTVTVDIVTRDIGTDVCITTKGR